MVETKAALGGIVPCFIVGNLAQTISFYTEKLGFETRYSGPDEDPYWAMLGRDDIMIFFKAVSPEVQPTPNSQRHEWAPWDAYIYVPEPDALAREFESNGCTFSKPLDINSDNLLGFEIQDPSGYTLYFGRPN